MSFLDFIGAHPILTVVLAFIVMWTIDGVCSSIWGGR